MIILPAIDIIGGKPVRLVQGDYNRKEVVAQSVRDTARSFQDQGAGWVHMVDLDGAKAGHPCNQELIVETAKSLDIPVEVGGGIRSLEDIAGYLDGGVARVILGTKALQDPDMLKKAVEKYGEKIAVGVDCKNGKVAVSGWLEDSGKDELDFIRELEKIGVSTIIYTDISKDGTLQGPNLQALDNIQKHTEMNVIASGGIHNLEDIQNLAAMNLQGAIAGKSLYAGTLDLKQAIEAGEKAC